MAVVGAIASTIVRSIVGALTDNDLPGGASGGGGGGYGFGATDRTTLTAVESFTLTVRSYQSIPHNAWLSPDGDWVITIGQGGDQLISWELPVAFDVSSATLASAKQSGVVLDDATPTGLWMNDAGTRVWYCGTSQQKVFEHTVSTPFDMSTITSAAVSVYDTTADGVTAPINISFNADGSKMYLQELPANYKINEFDLGTEFDVSTATFVQEYDYATDISSAYANGFFINGTEIYLNAQDDKLYKFTWDGNDVTTMSYVGSQAYTQGELAQRGLWMNADYVAYVDSGGDDQIHVHAWGPHS